MRWPWLMLGGLVLGLAGCGGGEETGVGSGGGGFDGPKLGGAGTNRPAGIEAFDDVPRSREVALDALLEVQKNQGQIVTFGPDGETVIEIMLSFGGSNENVVRSLKYFPHLERVSLPTIATDDWVVHLKPLRELKFVGLPKGVTDAALVHLEELPVLETFSPEFGAKFTDAGMKSLARIETLRTVVVRESDITDAGLMTLSELPNLELVNITGTKVTPEGRAAFAAAKPGCRILPKQ